MLISGVNGARAVEHFIAPFLVEAGFTPSAQGFHLLRRPFEVTSPAESLMRDAATEDAGDGTDA